MTQLKGHIKDTRVTKQRKLIDTTLESINCVRDTDGAAPINYIQTLNKSLRNVTRHKQRNVGKRWTDNKHM